MSIETNKYFFNKNMHVELATELNVLSIQKNVQVSRWVNNSKNRQIVTYIVHTGERNAYASKQEGVLFTISEDAGRGNKITDETDMMAAVRKFLNSIVIEAPETPAESGIGGGSDEPLYRVVSDLLGQDVEYATLSQIEDVANDFEYDGWTLRVLTDDWHVVLEAVRDGAEDWKPSWSNEWRDSIGDGEVWTLTLAEIKVS